MTSASDFAWTARVAVARVANGCTRRDAVGLVEADAIGAGIRLEAARLEIGEHLRDARLVADGRKRIFLRTPRISRVRVRWPWTW